MSAARAPAPCSLQCALRSSPVDLAGGFHGSIVPTTEQSHSVLPGRITTKYSMPASEASLFPEEHRPRYQSLDLHALVSHSHESLAVSDNSQS